MAKRIPVTVKKTFRIQTPEEQIRFEQAIDRLIGELVEKEMRRLEEERTERSNTLLRQQSSTGLSSES